VPERARAKSFGVVGAGFGLGFVLGPAAGGMLGGIEPRLPFWVAAGLSLCTFLWGAFALPETLPPDRRAPLRWRAANPLGALALLRARPGLTGLAGAAFLGNLAHEVLPTVFVLYATHRYGWSTTTIGLCLACVGIGWLVAQGRLVGVAVDRLGERHALLLGLGSGAAGLAGYGLAAQGWQFWLAILPTTLWALAGPAYLSLMSRRVAPEEQGRLQGALQSLRAIAGLLGPGLFSLTFATSIDPARGLDLPGLAFLIAAVLLLAAALLAGCAAAGQGALPPAPPPGN